MSANHAAKPKKGAGVFETNCPQCDHMIKLSSRSQPGEKILCPVCHTQLEIVGTNPVELDLA
jgi:uncharacterized paraquat-inducible protein A